MSEESKGNLESCEYCKPKNHFKRWLFIGGFFILIVIAFALTKQNAFEFLQFPKQSSESDSLNNKYWGWKECKNFGLNLSLQLPEGWYCESNEVAHNIGNIGIKGDSFLMEFENLGRSYGCMEDNTCTDTVIYSRDIISLHLVAFNGKDDYIFGIFNDSYANRSYGGVVLSYEGIGEREMSDLERETLFKIMDSLKHGL